MPSITKQLFLAEESKEEFHLPRQHIACHQFYALILWNYWIPSEGGIELVVKLLVRPPPLTKYLKEGTVIFREWPLFLPVKLTDSTDA